MTKWSDQKKLLYTSHTYLHSISTVVCKYVSTSSWQVIFYTMKKLENLELVPTFSIFFFSFLHDNFMHYKKNLQFNLSVEWCWEYKENFMCHPSKVFLLQRQFFWYLLNLLVNNTCWIHYCQHNELAKKIQKKDIGFLWYYQIF